MRPILTADQMRAMDEATITQVGIPGAVLMETAGRAVVGAVLRELTSSGRDSGRVVVICGAGNNGGDGFVVARVLEERGVDCELYLCVDESKIAGDAKIYLNAFVNCGGVVHLLRTSEDLGRARSSVSNAVVIVDAIFGTGLCRDVEGHFAEVVAMINDAEAKVVAVDIPSGLSADTGAVLGTCVEADTTVTMAAAKVGNAGAPGFAFNGRLEIAEIGIPARRIGESARAFLVEGSDVAPLLPNADRNTHKGRKGHVLAIAGEEGKRGAGRLAGSAALRSGAGLVTLGAALPDGAAPDPLMSAVVTDIESLEAAWQGKTALLVGPGMATSPQAATLVFHALSTCPVPLLIDADGLNHLASAPEKAMECSVPVVLTPHPKEAARLLRNTVADVQSDRFSAARRLAATTGAVVVLKGARTCVVDGRDPAGIVFVCEQGGPELATAGTGDVLAGIVAGLLAQGIDALDAARLGVYWHGLAGQRALQELGGPGVIASDVAQAIPEARAMIAASE